MGRLKSPSIITLICLAQIFHNTYSGAMEIGREAQNKEAAARSLYSIPSFEILPSIENTGHINRKHIDTFAWSNDGGKIATYNMFDHYVTLYKVFCSPTKIKLSGEHTKLSPREYLPIITKNPLINGGEKHFNFAPGNKNHFILTTTRENEDDIDNEENSTLSYVEVDCTKKDDSAIVSEEKLNSAIFGLMRYEDYRNFSPELLKKFEKKISNILAKNTTLRISSCRVNKKATFIALLGQLEGTTVTFIIKENIVKIIPFFSEGTEESYGSEAFFCGFNNSLFYTPLFDKKNNEAQLALINCNSTKPSWDVFAHMPLRLYKNVNQKEWTSQKTAHTSKTRKLVQVEWFQDNEHVALVFKKAIEIWKVKANSSKGGSQSCLITTITAQKNYRLSLIRWNPHLAILGTFSETENLAAGQLQFYDLRKKIPQTTFHSRIHKEITGKSRAKQFDTRKRV